MKRGKGGPRRGGATHYRSRDTVSRRGSTEELVGRSISLMKTENEILVGPGKFLEGIKNGPLKSKSKLHPFRLKGWERQVKGKLEV